MARRAQKITIYLSLLLLAATASAPAAAAQAPQRLAFLNAPDVRTSTVLARGGYAVIIDLDDMKLHFVQGRTVLWSAPVATGMPLELRDGNRKWNFLTPPGVYQVEYKAENPVWIADDWYFIENKLPVPPRNDPSRRIPGGLGAAAVYIGQGLAIHGTDKPDLLGQRVSHGCIRMSNDDAQRLLHNVQIGTQVIIVGGDPNEKPGVLVPGNVPGTGPVDARTERLRQRAKAERDRRLEQLRSAPLDALAVNLAAALAERSATGSAWPDLASELVRRAVADGDTDAAHTLLAAAGTVRNRQVRAEFVTFLTDLTERAPMQTVRALAKLDTRAREHAATAIVDTAIRLYRGSPADLAAPWPTSRFGPSRAGDSSARGLAALAAAEKAYRERITQQQSSATEAAVGGL